MRKAYLFIVHETSLLLEETVKSLSFNKNNIVIIHVDKKKELEEFESLTKDNVLLINDRVDVRWGGWSLIEATLKLIEYALNYDFEYCFLVSGYDIPIMSEKKTNDFLSNNIGVNFIDYQDSRDNYVDPLQRVKYFYPKLYFNKKRSFIEKVVCKTFNFTKNTLFINKEVVSYLRDEDIRVYKGSQWFTLTNDTVREILKYLQDNPRFKNIYKNSFCADESFFQTIIKRLNSPKLYHDESAINDCLRYIDWYSGPEFPKELTTEDLSSIADKNFFFARKVSRDISDEYIINYLRRYNEG